MKIFHSVLLILLVSMVGKAQTVLPSTISSNKILVKAESPYLINANLTVDSTVKLIIEPGVVINIAPKISLNIKGEIQAYGTKTDSIVFKCSQVGSKWSIINVSGKKSIFSFVKVRDAVRFVSATGGELLSVSNCTIESKGTGNGEDCIAAHDTKKVTLNQLYLYGMGGPITATNKNDAIDLDNIDSCFVNNCTVTRFSDDGIDIGTHSKYAYIAQNNISYCNFSITVGESAKAYLYRNICSHSDAGIQSHTKAIVYASNNTLYANTDGLECYHSEDGETKETGGTIFMTNIVFSKNTRYNLRAQSSSVYTIINSISDKEVLAGLQNLKADAMLVNPENNDCRLKTGSPCIDAGAEDMFKQFKGKAADMGAIEFDPSTTDLLSLSKVNKMNVFPNPGSNQLTVSLSQTNKATYRFSILDFSGRVISKGSINTNDNLVDISKLSKGSYTFVISDKDVFIYKKFIKN